MSPPLDLALETAAAAMEAGEWAGAIGLLVQVLGALEGEDAHATEAATRLLLAQSLASTDQLDDAIAQVTLAQEAAERSDDRDVIHRCMALRASLNILAR